MLVEGGKSWDTSCQNWPERIMTGRSLVPELPLFQSEVDKAVRIFRRLRIPDAIGQPTMADAAGEWLYPIISAIFGSYNPVANVRMIREFFLLIPKKNGKSGMGGAIMLVAMIVNKRMNAEYLLVAPTKEISGIAFRTARDIINLDPELKKLFHPQEHKKTITHKLTGATLQIKAADSDVITGSKATGILIDETHVFSKRANAADIFVEIRGGLAARPDGFLIQITTQSKEPPVGVFKAELEIARDVRDGKVSFSLLPVMYEFPEHIANSDTDDWKNPRYWGLVNPNLGRSVQMAFLLEQLEKAERTGKEDVALFASQYLDLEIGLRQRSDNWVGAEFWLSAVDKELTLKKILKTADVIVVGIDGGGLDDLLAMTVLGRHTDSRIWMSWGHAWAARIVLTRRKSEAPTLLDFERQGDLTIVDDMQDAYDDVAKRCAEIDEDGLLASVGIDPSGVGLILDALAAVDIEGDERIKGVFQDRPLQGAIKTVEVKLAAKKLRHCDQPLMNWAVSNARIERKTNYIMVTKAASGTAKIDPLMSLFDAANEMAKNPTSTRSAYEDEDFLV